MVRNLVLVAVALSALWCAAPAFAQGSMLVRFLGQTNTVIGDVGPDSPDKFLAIFAMDPGDFGRAGPDGTMYIHMASGADCEVVYLEYIGGDPDESGSYVPVAFGTGLFNWSGTVRWADPDDPSQGVVTDSEMISSFQADFSLGGAYSSLDYQIVYRDYEVIYWRSSLQ